MSDAGKTRIRPCSCQSTFQDKRYGKNNRVHNCGEKECSCTVCGTRKRLDETPKWMKGVSR